MVPSQASPTPQPMMRKTMKMAAQMAIQRRICFRCGILGVVLFVIALDPMCKQKGQTPKSNYISQLHSLTYEIKNRVISRLYV